MDTSAERSECETVAAIIIVWNEAVALEKLLPDMPRDQIDDLIVVDGGSTDGSADVATRLGARVVTQSGRGYGDACLSGARATACDILVFLDGDFADDPRDFMRILEPVAQRRADLVIGTRNGPGSEPGSLPRHQRFGNLVACLLIRMLYRVRMNDIGSFRAIRRDTLFGLNMKELTYGWPVEMVVKAARESLIIEQVAVRYRRRIGVSKVGGTLPGSVRAGWLMIIVILRHSRNQRFHKVSGG